jgi:hypothetical protein
MRRWGIGDRVDYALESSMFVTGAGIQWLRERGTVVGLTRGSSRTSGGQTLSATSPRWGTMSGNPYSPTGAGPCRGPDAG